MLSFVLEGETPSKKNNRIVNRKTGATFPSKKYTEWHKVAKNLVQSQALMQARDSGFQLPINKPCQIKMLFAHGDLSRRDSDNEATSILDLLQDCDVLADDCWQIVRELNIKNTYFQGKSFCKIVIESL